MKLPWVSRRRYERLAGNVERLERSRRDLKARNKYLAEHADEALRLKITGYQKALATMGRQIAKLEGRL